MKILITGGCGFLGQHLTKALLAQYPKARITLLDLRKNPYPVHDFSKEKRVTTLLGDDITDAESMMPQCKGMDTVIHLAGIVSFSLRDKALLHKVNVVGTKNILAAAKKAKVKRFLHISSVAALGYSDSETELVDEGFIFDWNEAKRHKKFYMLTKHLADLEVEKAIKKGFPAIILYLGLMYGPGDATNASRLIMAIKDGKIPFDMPGGTNLLDVRDVAAGIVSALQGGKKGEGYLLSGHNLSFSEINETIAKQVTGKRPKTTLPRWLNAPLFHLVLLAERLSKKRLQLTADNVDSAFKYRYFDNSKAVKELKWKPHYTFAQTIRDTIAWLQENDLLTK